MRDDEGGFLVLCVYSRSLSTFSPCVPSTIISGKHAHIVEANVEEKHCWQNSSRKLQHESALESLESKHEKINVKY
jgi:hypothetical protein